MKTVVLGANGYIGSAVVGQLVAAGHETTGLVRSSAAAAGVKAAGAQALIGDATDHEFVTTAIHSADAVVMCAQLLLEPERHLVDTILGQLEGTGRTFVFTSGTGVLSQRTDGEWSEDTFAERDDFTPSKYIGARHETELTVQAAASRGVRSMVIRPAMVWGNGGGPMFEAFYRSAGTGSVCYVGRGLNLYSSVHVDDVADLFVRAITAGSAGALYHAVSGETNFRTIAEAVARDLGVGTRSVNLEEAMKIWDKFTALVAMSVCSRTRAPRSRSELGWSPATERSDILDGVGHPRLRALASTSP